MGCRELSIREKYTFLRTSQKSSGNRTDYTTHKLNQYTSLTSLPSVQNPSYDTDGNMLTVTLGTPSPSSAWSYTWNPQGHADSTSYQSRELRRFFNEGCPRLILPDSERIVYYWLVPKGLFLESEDKLA